MLKLIFIYYCFQKTNKYFAYAFDLLSLYCKVHECRCQENSYTIIIFEHSDRFLLFYNLLKIQLLKVFNDSFPNLTSLLLIHDNFVQIKGLFFHK